MDVSGLGVLAVGLVLCFSGRRSLQVAVLASGFALGCLVAEVLGAQLLTTAVAAVVAALARGPSPGSFSARRCSSSARWPAGWWGRSCSGC